MSRGGDLTVVGVTPASLVIAIAPFLPFFSMPYSRVATSCSSPGEICGCVNGVPSTARDPHRSAQVHPGPLSEGGAFPNVYRRHVLSQEHAWDGCRRYESSGDVDPHVSCT